MGSSKTFAPEAIICYEAHGEAIICKPSISLFTKTAAAKQNSAGKYHQQLQQQKLSEFMFTGQSSQQRGEYIMYVWVKGLCGIQSQNRKTVFLRF